MTTGPKWLTGKVALVLGDASGTDAVANAIAAQGANVLRGNGAPTDAAQIVQCFEDCGAIDLLVHAGTQLPACPADVLSHDVWAQGFSADLDGRYLHAAEFARRCLAAGKAGSILFLMPALAEGPGWTMVRTAHGALDNLVKTLAVEWSRDGIRVNAIASSTVSDFAASSEEEQQSLEYLAAYLLSDYAAYVTGTVGGIADGHRS